VGRYTEDPLVGGIRFGTSEAIDKIRSAAASGQISTAVLTLTEGHRLDTVAGLLLGDGRLWWVIAALSGIGWGLQVPPGTRIVYPTDARQLEILS